MALLALLLFVTSSSLGTIGLLVIALNGFIVLPNKSFSIAPNEEEIINNSRARSAKLRIAEKN